MAHTSLSRPPGLGAGRLVEDLRLLIDLTIYGKRKQASRLMDYAASLRLRVTTLVTEAGGLELHPRRLIAAGARLAWTVLVLCAPTESMMRVSRLTTGAWVSWRQGEQVKPRRSGRTWSATCGAGRPAPAGTFSTGAFGRRSAGPEQAGSDRRGGGRLAVPYYLVHARR